MKYLIAIDDTDMPGTKGTGWLVQEMCVLIEEQALGSCSAISRHQLFVHEDVPFTSHNSSMCFEFDAKEEHTLSKLKELIIAYLKEHAIPGSDPGFCVLDLSCNFDKDLLLQYGKRAKTEVLSKAIAYETAEKLGIYLSEHGGTGDGVVGALAGVALRLAGNDGRYRGWHHLGQAGDKISCNTIMTTLPFVDAVLDPTGNILPTDTLIEIGSEKIKTVRVKGMQVIQTVSCENNPKDLRTITNWEAKSY